MGNFHKLKLWKPVNTIEQNIDSNLLSILIHVMKIKCISICISKNMCCLFSVYLEKLKSFKKQNKLSQ